MSSDQKNHPSHPNSPATNQPHRSDDNPSRDAGAGHDAGKGGGQSSAGHDAGKGGGQSGAGHDSGKGGGQQGAGHEKDKGAGH